MKTNFWCPFSVENNIFLDKSKSNFKNGLDLFFTLTELACASEAAPMVIKKQESNLVKSPFVSGCSAALECKLWKTIDIPGTDRSKLTGNYSIIGEVVGIHINDEYLIDFPL